MLANQQKKKVEIAKIRVKLNVLKDDLETAVRERDFMKAQDLQMEIDEGDENLTTLQEELALLVVPRSIERSAKAKARVEQVRYCKSKERRLCILKTCIIEMTSMFKRSLKFMWCRDAGRFQMLRSFQD